MSQSKGFGSPLKSESRGFHPAERDSSAEAQALASASPSEALFHLSAYKYELPQELIAQKAAEPRDQSRLLVLHRKDGRLEHRVFTDFPEYFDAQDLLIANNTAVLRARLLGQRLLPDGKLGGKVEMLLLERHGDRLWEGAFHSSARQLPGLKFRIPLPQGGWIEGELVRGARESSTGTVMARFDVDPVEAGAGEIPLPHYMERSPDASDESRYQTIYAKERTSAAAPTAGLHFTPRVLDALRSKGAGWGEITLNVGLGTFRPVKVSDIRQHAMHEEGFRVPEEVAQAVAEKRAQGGRITAVGTTSVRTLESAWSGHGLQAGPGRTGIFIHPGYAFRGLDRLLTNFHLPESTLLMLVCAFAGYENTMHAYEVAVRERYRFFSYGDAMLIV